MLGMVIRWRHIRYFKEAPCKGLNVGPSVFSLYQRTLVFGVFLLQLGIHDFLRIGRRKSEITFVRRNRVKNNQIPMAIAGDGSLSI